MIKNECDNLIAIAQYETEHAEENIIRIRKDQWQEFHWTDHKRKDCLVMSLCNRVTGNVIGWSGRFKIDKVTNHRLYLICIYFFILRFRIWLSSSINLRTKFRIMNISSLALA